MRCVRLFAAISTTMLGLSCAGPMEPWGDGGDPGPGDAGGCVVGQASAQFRGQRMPPSAMRPGERAQVSVTFDNCSGQAWSAGEFALIPRPGASNVWGVARVALSREVPVGGRVEIPFEVRAPVDNGTYAFAWVIAREGGESFQEPSPEVPVVVQAAADCAVEGPVARFRSQQRFADDLGVGEPVRGAVTFANCGQEPWTRESVSLVTSLAMGVSHVGVTRVPLPTDVTYGSEVTVPIAGTTPSAPGVYPYAWRIERDGASLGDASPEQTFRVNHRFDCGENSSPVRFVSQNHPTVLNPGEAASADITFANCGSAVWDAAYRVQSAAPAAPGAWGAGNLAFALPIAPGFRSTLRFGITAPRTAGDHAYRWAVSRGEVALSEPSPARTINVRLGAGPCEGRPVPGGVTSPYGYRIHPISGVYRLHTGIDFNGSNNVTQIRVCRPGVVIQAGPRGSYGNTIEVSHGGGMSTLYAHQHHFAPGIGVGASVSGSQWIGVVGSTGASTGAHLHFEVRINGAPVNPNPYL
ncbi:MAG: M23 family metallopeptidase [Deltaproteobacteria bacterium]|nr:M23 family metallopeptidase [Deltaproteobacteria bacterium]